MTPPKKADAICPESTEAEDDSFHLIAECPVKARIMRYATFGILQMSELDIQMLK